VPAYESLQENSATARRMMGALLRGVSTREYAEVLPEMAETVGVSRSSVSRQAIEGSVEQLRQLRERRWDKADLLVLYIDGQRFGSHHVISAVGGSDRSSAGSLPRGSLPRNISAKSSAIAISEPSPSSLEENKKPTPPPRRWRNMKLSPPSTFN
jgi:hypothetical protein